MVSIYVLCFIVLFVAIIEWFLLKNQDNEKSIEHNRLVSELKENQEKMFSYQKEEAEKAMVSLKIGYESLLRMKQEETDKAAGELKSIMEKQNQDIKAVSLSAENYRLSATEQITNLTQKNAELETRLKEQLQKYQEQIELLNQAKEQMKQEFENLAQKIFEEKGKTFVEQNKSNLDLILNPFRQQITDFKQKVEEVYTNEGKERFSLTEQIKKMHEAYESLSNEANNLVRALKADTKTQGDWGEINLKRILEFTGLKEGLHYFVQPNYQTSGGETFRPDIVVNLPDMRQIIIDSKVSLTGYERYFNATDETEKEQGIKDHLKSVRKHIQELSDKKYEDLKDINTLDFVLMFIPVEAAYFVALNNDVEIYQMASVKKVLIVCPSTLLITLQLVNSLWRIDAQSKNVIKIAEQGSKLYDKFVGFVENFTEIKSNLDKTIKSYENAHGQLVDGSGNLISQAQKLIDLGVKSKKQLSNKLLLEAHATNGDKI
jgi:DNA recombination protein RmuC